jgi:hypothetical protein
VKGALLLAESPHVFTATADVLRGEGATYIDADGGVVQLTDDDGRLLTVFKQIGEATERTYRDDVEAVMPGVQPPDMSLVTACDVECRWEDLFVSVMRLLADRLTEPVWVLDGDGVLWAAGAVDPRRVVL